jgi:hypothetical protein
VSKPVTPANAGAHPNVGAGASRQDLQALIAAASGPAPQAVDVPGLGRVYVRVMTAYDSDIARKALEAARADDGCEIGRLLATVLCDAGGAPLYDIANAADVMMLSRLPGAVNEAVFKAHRAANGVVTSDAEAEALGKA